MARRRPVPTDSGPVLPWELRPENVTVETFVSRWEEPAEPYSPLVDPSFEGGSYPSWRRLRAWRRWQEAVTAWGAAQGLSITDLRKAGLWPTHRPPFASEHR